MEVERSAAVSRWDGVLSAAKWGWFCVEVRCSSEHRDDMLMDEAEKDGTIKWRKGKRRIEQKTYKNEQQVALWPVLQVVLSISRRCLRCDAGWVEETSRRVEKMLVGMATHRAVDEDQRWSLGPVSPTTKRMSIVAVMRDLEKKSYSSRGLVLEDDDMRRLKDVVDERRWLQLREPRLLMGRLRWVERMSRRSGTTIFQSFRVFLPEPGLGLNNAI
jgi:hypothetical protein